MPINYADIIMGGTGSNCGCNCGNNNDNNTNNPMPDFGCCPGGDYYEERPIRIDINTRNLIIPKSQNRQVAVAYDCNSNKTYFTCERYIEGQDVLNCSFVLVKWQNLKSKVSGKYVAYDLELSEFQPNCVQFSWTAQPEMTTMAGPLVIQICFITLAADGLTVEFKWNSSPCKEFYVGPGIYNPDIDAGSGNGESELLFIYKEDLDKMLEEVYGDVG